MEVNSNPTNAKGLIVFIIAIFAVGSAAFFGLRAGDESNNSPLSQETGSKGDKIITEPIAPQTLVYGGWTGNGSEIKTLDLQSGDFKTIAQLPINIKKVTVISPDQMLYIDQTDDRDHGKQITTYSVNDKVGTSTITSAEGFGIDDYVISPNNNYVATWEVSFAPDSPVLIGGRSRVYAVNLSNPVDKKLLYDEVAAPNAPIHYPRAILNDGTVFADTFLPNDPNGGTGWAYGMSVVNFDGSSKQELEQMKNGTYGTQPVLSPDGQYLAFAGYDGSLGDGRTLQNGYRLALVNPNTVELLNTKTLARTKLENLPNIDTYINVRWDTQPGSVLFTQLSSEPLETGPFYYELATKTKKKALTGDGGATVVTRLSPDKVLVGSREDSPSAAGNLGEDYDNAFNQFSVMDTKDMLVSPLQLTDLLMQYITLVPAEYFEATANVMNDVNGQTVSTGAEDNLQLRTFSLKTHLGSIREQQQSTIATPSATIPLPSNIAFPSIPFPSLVIPPPGIPGITGGSGVPRCRDLSAQQCAGKGAEGSTENTLCQAQAKVNNRLQGLCYDSPLYLYGKTGQQIIATIHTPVFNAIPAYNNGYKVTLRDGGKMEVGGKLYTGLTYDYAPQSRKILPPPYGKIVSQNEVGNVLQEYAKGLGLNEKETADLVRTGRQKITSPYAFVSFFNQKQSEAILPISFTPKPDNYLNVVFYFKLLDEKPNLSIPAPEFGSPLQRDGFTAVEVSEIVE